MNLEPNEMELQQEVKLIMKAGTGRTWEYVHMSSRTWQLTLVFSPGASHGRRSLEGYSPQVHKESDTTEVT